MNKIGDTDFPPSSYEYLKKEYLGSLSEMAWASPCASAVVVPTNSTVSVVVSIFFPHVSPDSQCAADIL